MADSREMERALSAVLDSVEGGEAAVEQALSRYPALRADLAPLASLAMELRAMPAVQAPDSLRGSKRPVFAPHPARRWARGWWSGLRLPAPLSYGWASTAVRAAAALAIALVLGSGTLVASAGSLPEEPLYPVKLALERAQLAITSHSGARADLEMQFAARRLEEVAAAVERRRTEAIEQSLAIYEEKVDSAISESGVLQESAGDDERIQEALKSNHEVLQRILSEEDKIENPRARAAIDAAAQRTIERSEELKERGKSEQKPEAEDESAPVKPGKADPPSGVPGQQKPVPPDPETGDVDAKSAPEKDDMKPKPAGKAAPGAGGSEGGKRNG